MIPASEAMRPPQVAGRVHHGRGQEFTVRRAHSAYGAPVQQDPGHLLTEVDLGARRGQQPGRRLRGLDLGVLRVVEAARQSRGQVRLQFVQGVRRHLHRVDAGGALALREGAQGLDGPVVGGDDEPALGLVLDLPREDRGELGPQARGQQGEVEFGSGLLVGDEQVAFMRRRWCLPRRGPGRPRPRRVRRGPRSTRRPPRRQPAPMITASRECLLSTTVICHIL